MRQLVTLETVSEINEHTNADDLEIAKIRGWNVIVRKEDNFNVGDSVLYFEYDSFLPVSDPRFAFLEPRGVRILDGVTGHPLKTARLRGEWSQGLIKHASDFPEGIPEIAKWEKPVPAEIEGQVEGHYLFAFAPKTDSERVENLGRSFHKILENEWTATEKIDGTSTTFINDNGTLRVCSRNYEISAPSARFELAEKLNILENLPEGHTLQGEYFGENIQSNPLKIKGTDFKAFNLFKKTEKGPVVVPYAEWPSALVSLRVPVLPLSLPQTIDEVVEQADGLMSQIAPQRRAEGIVWQGTKGFTFLGERPGFKAISRTYLLKQKD